MDVDLQLLLSIFIFCGTDDNVFYEITRPDRWRRRRAGDVALYRISRWIFVAACCHRTARFAAVEDACTCAPAPGDLDPLLYSDLHYHRAGLA